jgi:hypothetical protein
MKNGVCTKQYPRQFMPQTRTDTDGYPLYKRRSPEDGGLTIHKKVNGQMYTVDNRYVVPYNPMLSKMFNAHINVESCHSVKAIKYICKYIYKGSDQAVLEISNSETANDEIKQYQIGRYINSNEAAWRLFGFALHDREPNVTHLAVHLENGQRVYFTAESVEQAVQHPRDTTLTAFFKLNQVDEFARTQLYSNIPSYYTWQERTKTWQRRARGQGVPNWPGIIQSDTIGRVFGVHPAHQECYYLRILLHHVKGATSFSSLRTVNGRVCATFKLACQSLGLLEDENHLQRLMQLSRIARNSST